ncbi:MAG: CotD family spore coat protein [Bacilli bacterium]|nr:CotD family spore coat protein [Bacilli bacterium]
MLFDRQCGRMPRQDMLNMQNMPMGFGAPGQLGAPGQSCPPIIEPAMTQCVEREFFHEVPHVCPKHTHVINKHIYRHTYSPQFSCSEENQMFNVNCGSCSQF